MGIVVFVRLIYNSSCLAFEAHYGLLSKDYTQDRIDLKDVKISCAVTSLTTNVHTTFTYFNQFDKSMDAKFVFPLLDVAVYAFEAHVENRVIIAECRPRMEAQTTYDEAVQSGHTAFLAQQDEHCEDIFQMSIGNVPSNATVMIILKYVGQLCAVNVSDVESQAVFTLPSVINPRFTPPGTTIKSEYDPFAIPSGVNSIPYAISFEASLCMPQDIVDVCSQRDTYSKEIDTSDKKRAKVKLVSKFKFDHDLQMVIKMSQPLQSIAVYESGGSTKPGGFLSMDCFLAQFVPDFSQLASHQETRTELVFVIDRSGSMHGQRITSAAESLLLFLKALPVGCRFQIIGFGSHHEALFPQPEDYNERTLENALQYQQSMTANMGGTDVLPALREAFDAPLTGQGWYRQIIFLTDGEVTNADEKCCSTSHLPHHAITCFWLYFPFILHPPDSTQLRGVVMKILGAALQPRAGEIKVCWNLKRSDRLVDVISIPTQIPPVYHKQIINAYGLIPAGNLSGLSGSVSLEYDVLGQKLTTLLDVSTVQKMLSSISADAPLHRLAGKCQLTELGDKYKTGLMNNKPKDDPEIKTLRDQIEKISCAINVISPVTSMVGVDPVKPDKPVSISSASNRQEGKFTLFNVHFSVGLLSVLY
ncbi:hypothetical protein P879_07148 [Paragonimus westermani]|uniref:von Willebrand factor A domain-containing protein 5A n=1 Tax=Paragonimus westermani TaxID=34504 RepID=A0A8T0DMY5_9TREM|nr:hypothetical protein P879_07148 [Paragonimus westermani]